MFCYISQYIYTVLQKSQNVSLQHGLNVTSCTAVQTQIKQNCHTFANCCALQLMMTSSYMDSAYNNSQMEHKCKPVLDCKGLQSNPCKIGWQHCALDIVTLKNLNIQLVSFSWYRQCKWKTSTLYLYRYQILGMVVFVHWGVGEVYL